MKKWLGFIVLPTARLVPMPVMAIGVSPYAANIDVFANSYTELVFNVTGCSSVDLYLEGIPLTVEPSHTSVVDSKITVKILGSPSVPSGIYEGYLVILESGQQVGAGVKISLTVNHTNNQSVMLTTTVLSSGGGYYGGGGGGTAWSRPPIVSSPATSPSSSPPAEPDEYNPPPGQPTYTPPAEPPAGTPEIPSGSPSWFYLVIVIGGLLAAYGLMRWFQKRSG